MFLPTSKTSPAYTWTGMRSSEWKRLAKPPLDDRWRFSKDLAYVTPIRWILYGLLSEDSASKPRFYLNVLRMPLYVPTDVVDLSWSDRFGGPSHLFHPNEAATRDALSEAAAQVVREAASGALLLHPPGGADNVRMMEARAYGLLLDGSPGGSVEVLRRVLRYEAHYPWQQELVERAQGMLSIIEAGQVGEALDRIQVWRRDSMLALGIVGQ